MDTNEPNREETLKKAADLLTDKPIQIKVEVLPKSKWHKFLQRYKIKPKEIVFEIRPLKMGAMLLISKELIDIEKMEGATFLDQTHSLIANHMERIAKIVAIGLRQTPGEPNEKDVRFILDNFNSIELKKVFNIIATQLNLADFISSIISIRGINILDERIASVNGAEKKEMSQQ